MVSNQSSLESLIHPHLLDILYASKAGVNPSPEHCVQMLSYPETSIEASIIRASADAISRKRFNNQALILGQIGIETAPCPANCKFCVFSERDFTLPQSKLTIDQIINQARMLTEDGDLYALFLMTMHNYDYFHLLDVVQAVREAIPSHTKIVINVGDFTLDQASQLKSLGITGAYHVCRLREGCDTDLNPQDRLNTIQAIKESELDWYYCCEPIGPEHTPDEIVDQLQLGVQYECFQHATMRRVYLEQAPLSEFGQISELRLAQITAVVALATLASETVDNIAVHEPNLLGLTSGANVVYAEAGANPRDIALDTATNRGINIHQAKTMLFEAGFTALRRGNNTTIPLTLESTLQTKPVSLSY
ncbi:hypothetical protein JD969_08985 [Planctomycetota bacterium]|nr:hypothetical protein JD969_08985 [Planctomycetota bacterium]